MQILSKVKTIKSNSERVFEKHTRLFLVLILLVFARITFVLGKQTGVGFSDDFQNLLSSLTAEIVGALIALIVIDQLLKYHEKAKLKHAHNLISKRISWIVSETLEATMNIIANTEYKLVDNTVLGKLYDSISIEEYKNATEIFDDLFTKTDFYPLAPKVYAEVRDMASKYIDKWIDLGLRFQPYLSPEQFSSFTEIIDTLRYIKISASETACSLDENSFIPYPKLYAKNLAPGLVEEIEILLHECVNLLGNLQ